MLFDHTLKIGDLLEIDDPHSSMRQGKVIAICELDPPANQRPFFVAFGGAVYGMGRDGTLYDTLNGRDTKLTARKYRVYRDFYVAMAHDKTIHCFLTRPTGTMILGARILSTSLLRWYEDGEIVQINEDGDTTTDTLRKIVEGEREARTNLFNQLRQKDEAMGVLMERMKQHGVSYDDLIS